MVDDGDKLDIFALASVFMPIVPYIHFRLKNKSMPNDFWFVLIVSLVALAYFYFFVTGYLFWSRFTLD